VRSFHFHKSPQNLLSTRRGNDLLKLQTAKTSKLERGSATAYKTVLETDLLDSGERRVKLIRLITFTHLSVSETLPVPFSCEAPKSTSSNSKGGDNVDKKWIVSFSVIACLLLITLGKVDAVAGNYTVGYFTSNSNVNAMAVSNFYVYDVNFGGQNYWGSIEVVDSINSHLAEVGMLVNYSSGMKQLLVYFTAENQYHVNPQSWCVDIGTSYFGKSVALEVRQVASNKWQGIYSLNGGIQWWLIHNFTYDASWLGSYVGSELETLAQANQGQIPLKPLQVFNVFYSVGATWYPWLPSPANKINIPYGNDYLHVNTACGAEWWQAAINW
jgi:hypothetical protein